LISVAIVVVVVVLSIFLVPSVTQSQSGLLLLLLLREVVIDVVVVVVIVAVVALWSGRIRPGCIVVAAILKTVAFLFWIRVRTICGSKRGGGGRSSTFC